MKKSDIFRGIIEAIIWFVFTWYLLYVLKNPVELWSSALILLVLMYAGVLVCPWVRHTIGWRKMIGKE